MLRVYGTEYKTLDVIVDMDSLPGREQEDRVICLLQRPNGQKVYTSTFKAGKFSKPLPVSCQETSL